MISVSNTVECCRISVCFLLQEMFSFYLELHSEKPVFIDVIFHVMSAQLIESRRTEEFGFTLMSVYFVPLVKRLIMTYRILVNKHERITLSSGKVAKKINVMIFDGSGFLSSVAFLQKERINIFTTTFQCVIQVIHHEYKKQKDIFSPIDYLAQPMEKKHINIKIKPEIV